MPKHFCNNFGRDGTVVNERQIAHLIGAQPVSESYDVGGCFWTFPVEIAQGMCPNICKVQERARVEKQESQNPLPPKK